MKHKRSKGPALRLGGEAADEGDEETHAGLDVGQVDDLHGHVGVSLRDRHEARRDASAAQVDGVRVVPM